MCKHPQLNSLTACAAGLILLAQSISPCIGEDRVKLTPPRSDVTLDNGTLQGKYLTPAGAPVAGAQVILRQGAREVANTVTNAQGEFTVGNLKTGVYEIQTAARTEQVRAWYAPVAPNTSAGGLTIISPTAMKEQVQRNPLMMYMSRGLGVVGSFTGIVPQAESDTVRRPANP